ncbi:MAG: hypothetical protein ACREGI_04955 [Candidatus Levyibacteriota bacterium]
MRQNIKQLLPIFLTLVTCGFFILLLFLFVNLLNAFPTKEKILLHFAFSDVLVGLTIYLKTSIDFAIFIGNVMHIHPGVKNRIAIEIGTACGNFLGTLMILTVWIFFKEVPILLVCMIFLASIVLLRLSQESLRDFLARQNVTAFPILFLLENIMEKVNNIFSPLISLMLPKNSLQKKQKRNFLSLFFFATSIPFVLGLDDFAGYIPLFSLVNVVGFATGVFLGHMLLNMFLFASPAKTTTIIRLPYIGLFGSIVFLAIGLYGFFEIGRAIIFPFFH